MAFNGTLFKFRDFKFPNEHIRLDTFKVKPNQRQNLDAYTDGNGVTHLNALNHSKTQVTFTTNSMDNASFRHIMDNIVKNYSNDRERSALCTYYDPEYDRYGTGKMYLDPSVEFTMKKLTEDGKNIERYGEISWLFIEC